MSAFALHPEAFEDIEEIRAYIASDSADSADRVVDEIFDAIRRLTRFPEQGFRRPNFTSLPIRFFPVREYLIAYASREETLWVIAVVHGRRSPRVIAALLRGRE